MFPKHEHHDRLRDVLSKGAATPKDQYDASKLIDFLQERIDKQEFALTILKDGLGSLTRSTP
jgi:hypothetical protein